MDSEWDSMAAMAAMASSELRHKLLEPERLSYLSCTQTTFHSIQTLVEQSWNRSGQVWSKVIFYFDLVQNRYLLEVQFIFYSSSGTDIIWKVKALGWSGEALFWWHMATLPIWPAAQFTRDSLRSRRDMLAHLLLLL